MSWRDRYRPRIAAIIAANSDKSLSEKRKALREAFPKGQHGLHTYKIWLSECRIQLGLQRSKIRVAGVPMAVESAPGQRSLFE